MSWYKEFTFSGSGGTDIHDLTDDIREAVRKWGVKDGIAVVFTPGSTAAVTTIEYEPGVLEDLRRAIEKIAPADIDYAHNAAWGDGNGYSHVRSALLGPSASIPIHEGALVLGTWQQVVLLDFDNRARRRRVVLQVHGE
jgi:secondary thiamine-phosphate synthase enzyme